MSDMKRFPESHFLVRSELLTSMRLISSRTRFRDFLPTVDILTPTPIHLLSPSDLADSLMLLLQSSTIRQRIGHTFVHTWLRISSNSSRAITETMTMVPFLNSVPYLTEMNLCKVSESSGESPLIRCRRISRAI